MSENKISLLSGQLTDKQEEALKLHYEIKNNGELAASAMVDFAKGLKTMRDKRMYLDLNFESFEEYVENAIGIKQRQAYNYINALESFGEKDLQSNAKLGITKLSILSQLDRFERQDFMENNDAENMSVRELKEATDKLHEAEEQLSFMSEENDKLKEENERLNAQQDMVSLANGTVEELQDEISRLKKDLKEERAKPKPAAIETREPTEEEIKELTAAAVENAKRQAQIREDRAITRAVEMTRAQVTRDLEEKYMSSLAEAEEEKESALLRLSEIEKQAKLSASPEDLKFKFYFEECQRNLNSMLSILADDDGTNGKMYKSAIQAIANNLLEVENDG